jgi:glycosyltransferase involved in cell wall biosynthesis
MEATGIPVISTRHADIPAIVPRPDELVAENDVEQTAEAMVRTARLNDREWDRVSLLGRAFVERYHDVRVVAPQLEALYRKAVSARGS